MEASNRRDGLLKIAPGLFGYDREIVKILRWLDAFFDSVGDAINAREILFPSLISLSTLNKIGYVDSFSDTLIYPSCYLPICKDIVKKKEGLKDVALTPAACFHIYPMYANNSFDDLENAIVTTQGKVFRYETRPRSKWRLYEFTVREFVFIGNLTFVTRMVEAFKSVSQEFAMQVGLPVVIESATDPFFLLLDNKQAVRKAQIPSPSKWEMSYRSHDQHNIALGSSSAAKYCPTGILTLSRTCIC